MNPLPSLIFCRENFKGPTLKPCLKNRVFFDLQMWILVILGRLQYKVNFTSKVKNFSCNGFWGVFLTCLLVAYYYVFVDNVEQRWRTTDLLVTM